MSYKNQYQSEFESEFETDTQAPAMELGDAYEFEDFEADSEYPDNEYEDDEYTDQAYEGPSYSLEYDGEQDVESRLYEMLNKEHESEFEYEQQLNAFMHEVENEFFWKKAFTKVKALAKNPIVRKLVAAGLNYVPGGAAVGAAINALPMDNVVKAVSQVSRKGLREGLTKLAGDYVQGKVPDMDTNEGNEDNGAEEEYGSQVSRGKVRDFLNIAEKAYENMADEIAKVHTATTPAQAQQILAAAPKMALSKAIQYSRVASRNGQSRRKKPAKRTEISISIHARVIVKHRKVIILEP